MDYMVKSVIIRQKILNEWEHKATLAIVLCINTILILNGWLLR